VCSQENVFSVTVHIGDLLQELERSGGGGNSRCKKGEGEFIYGFEGTGSMQGSDQEDDIALGLFVKDTYKGDCFIRQWTKSCKLSLCIFRKTMRI
jgi:hypothetical protein